MKKIVGVIIGLNDIKVFGEMFVFEELELGGDYIIDFIFLFEKDNLKLFFYNLYVWLNLVYY